jgi:hypothetical protein
VLRETELIRDASVGSHYYFPFERERSKPHTLLLAVPPAGRMTFAAMQSQRQVDRVSELFQVGIAFTVYPDAWHKEQARTRFGVDLEFLDDAPCNGLDPGPPFSGSRLAGSSRSSARSRQPFLSRGAM